jgi:hypothetical protein
MASVSVSVPTFVTTVSSSVSVPTFVTTVSSQVDFRDNFLLF